MHIALRVVFGRDLELREVAAHTGRVETRDAGRRFLMNPKGKRLAVWLKECESGTTATGYVWCSGFWKTGVVSF